MVKRVFTEKEPVKAVKQRHQDGCAEKVKEKLFHSSKVCICLLSEIQIHNRLNKIEKQTVLYQSLSISINPFQPASILLKHGSNFIFLTCHSTFPLRPVTYAPLPQKYFRL